MDWILMNLSESTGSFALVLIWPFSESEGKLVSISFSYRNKLAETS